MEVIPRSTGKEPTVKRLSVKNWLNGTVTAFDDGRTPLEGLKFSGNTWLEQDGTVRPRPSLVRYGPQPLGKVLGEIFEYKKVSGSTRENWLISMQSFGVSASPSASVSPSSSTSPSSSRSPSASASSSASTSTSPSASASISPSSSRSPSASTSISPSASLSPSASVSASRSPSSSASLSQSPSSSVSASPSNPPTNHSQIYIARPEDTSWTAVTGKYFDDDARAHFFQIAGKVVIMNGSDTLSYLDIATATVIPFTALGTPSAPTLTTNNVGGTGFTVTYRITANSTVGETAASSALAVTVDTDRDLWNPPSAGGTDNIIIGWSAVASAVSYNVYMGTVSGFEYLIASGVNGTVFTDDGTAAQDNTRLYPTTNSTAGPKATRGANIGGRAFLVGDTDHPYYVWNGGDPGFELDFSPANGGGYSLINSGGKELPQVVKLHRDGKGSATIKVYCSGTKGKRFSMTPDQLTYGNTVISFYDVNEDEGEAGTNAPDGILYYNNSMYYPSSEGFETDGTLPQIQNVLTTKKASNTIQPDIATINQDAMDNACSMIFDGRLLWGLPVNSDTNNEVWVLDLERKGAWMKPWSIAADWMWVITDNTGNVHHMVLSNNIIYDLSYSALTNDDGESFVTSGQSGQIYFSDDKRMWAQLLMVIIVVLRPQGEINFQITGKTEDAPLVGLGEPTTFLPDASSTVVGWGETDMYLLGWGRNRWSEVDQVPTDTSDATQEIPIEIDEEVQWFSYAWATSKVGADYNISDVVAEYVETGIHDLS